MEYMHDSTHLPCNDTVEGRLCAAAGVFQRCYSTDEFGIFFAIERYQHEAEMLGGCGARRDRRTLGKDVARVSA
jgi:hypothetical protein